MTLQLACICLYDLVLSARQLFHKFLQLQGCVVLRRVASCYTCLYGIRAKAPCRPGKSGPDSADLAHLPQACLLPRSPPPATAPSGSPEGLRGHSWQVPRYNAVPVPAIKDKDEEVASPRNGQRSRCSKFDCWTKLITNEKGCRTRAALGL